MALGSFAVTVGLEFGVVAEAADGDEVNDSVGLSVASAVGAYGVIFRRRREWVL